MTEPSPLWPEVLEYLKLQMTRASFGLFNGSSASRQNGTLTVYIASPLALDWIEHRYRKNIERAVSNIAGQPLEVKFTALAGPEQMEQPELFFTGTYRDAYNEITQVNRPSHYSSWYFHRKWLPILGPDLWTLVWEMRTRCYRDKDDNTKSRDTVEATLPDIAKSIGLSLRTVRRLLFPTDPDRQQVLAKFITRIGVSRGYNKRVGKVVNEKTIWKIRLDDPMTPDDEKRFNAMVSTCQNDT